MQAIKFMILPTKIYIEGRIQTRKWTDKEGQERYSTEIIANEMKMLGKLCSILCYLLAASLVLLGLVTPG